VWIWVFNEGSNHDQLSGETTIVTCKSPDFRASALALGKAGAEVWSVIAAPLARLTRGRSDQVVNQIMSEGDRVYAIGADLATAEGPQKLVFDMRLIGEDRLGVWVASAGILKPASIEE
jgi:3-oxoacyl-[acyl-carrier protein] reductase